ncbi:serine--tRNA ligase, partial [bacterium]|nr:serine--tRNA ligase [bacterium]
MLDINLLRDKPDIVRDALRARQMETDIVDRVLHLDQERRSLLGQVEVMKAERNAVSKEIGRMKEPAERQAKIEAMRVLGDTIASLDEKVREVDVQLQNVVATIPNLPDPRTPYGAGEHDNVVLRQIGDLPTYDFTPKPHWDLGPQLGIIDFDRGVKITGSRFYILNGAGARLQRALIAWMLDLHA